MSLHQCRQAKFITYTEIAADRLLIKECTDQQDAVRSKQFCLIQLIFIHDKILAEHWQLYRRPYLPEYSVRSQKPLWLRQAGNRIRPRSLVTLGDTDIVKYRINDSL